MEEMRNPKPAEDVAGDTQTQDASQPADAESARPNGMSWGETTAGDETSSMNEETSDSVSSTRDAVDVEQGTQGDETNTADPV